MPKNPNPPPENIFAINLIPLRTFLFDLPPRGTLGMRHELDGWQAVVTEIVSNQPAYGDRAGITATDFTRFTTLNGQMDQIDTQRPPVAKGVEVLTESLAYIDNRRHQLATQFANSAEAHARMAGGTPTLLTAYEKTIAYRSISADKGVKTREKNKEEKKKAPAPGTTPPAGGTASPSAGASGTSSATSPSRANGANGATGPAKHHETISRVPNPPPDDIFTIDLKPLKSFIVDLPAGATRGMRQEQEGWNDVYAEIVNNQPTYGDQAGITTTDFNTFVALNAQYDQIAAQLPLVEKAHEVLTESHAFLDDLRHKLVTQFADTAEAHSRGEGGDPTLLTAYQKTIAYRGAIASKAAKTRKKNEEKKAASGTNGTTGAAAATGSAAHAEAAGSTAATGTTSPAAPAGASAAKS